MPVVEDMPNGILRVTSSPDCPKLVLIDVLDRRVTDQLPDPTSLSKPRIVRQLMEGRRHRGKQAEQDGQNVPPLPCPTPDPHFSRRVLSNCLHIAIDIQQR